MPAQAIADRAETKLPAKPIVLEDMPIVTRGPDEVQANAVPSPVRRAFKASLEKADEGIAELSAH